MVFRGEDGVVNGDGPGVGMGHGPAGWGVQSAPRSLCVGQPVPLVMSLPQGGTITLGRRQELGTESIGGQLFIPLSLQGLSQCAAFL